VPVEGAVVTSLWQAAVGSRGQWPPPWTQPPPGQALTPARWHGASPVAAWAHISFCGDAVPGPACRTTAVHHLHVAPGHLLPFFSPPWYWFYGGHLARFCSLARVAECCLAGRTTTKWSPGSGAQSAECRCFGK